MEIVEKIISSPTLLTSSIILLVVVATLLIILFKKKLIIVYAGKEYGIKDLGKEEKGSLSIQPIIKGRRLFEYEGYYPIDVEQGTNIPSLNPEIFVKAINYFLTEVDDKLAVMDLIYLREDNKKHIKDPLRPKYQRTYQKLIDKYDLLDYQRNYSVDTELLFQNYIRIISDIGKTLEGVFFESLLHNVRNPLRSIIAASNSQEVSRRSLHDPSTRFVVQYVKHQGRDLYEAFKFGSKVAYPKQFTTNKLVKATTTPLYHEQLGLIGIICFNIDIEKINNLDKSGRNKFFSDYVQTSGSTPKFEIDDAPKENAIEHNNG